MPLSYAGIWIMWGGQWQIHKATPRNNVQSSSPTGKATLCTHRPIIFIFFILYIFISLSIPHIVMNTVASFCWKGHENGPFQPGFLWAFPWDSVPAMVGEGRALGIGFGVYNEPCCLGNRFISGSLKVSQECDPLPHSKGQGGAGSCSQCSE